MFLSKLFGKREPLPELSVDEVKERLSGKGSVQVVDVRQPMEFQGGHIRRARLIPLGQVASRAGELKPDKETIVVCLSGHRSARATRVLMEAGFNNISSMRGGMAAWHRRGYPVER